MYGSYFFRYAWLKASSEYGTTNPLKETKVTFTVAESTPIGKYEETDMF